MSRDRVDGLARLDIEGKSRVLGDVLAEAFRLRLRELPRDKGQLTADRWRSLTSDLSAGIIERFRRDGESVADTIMRHADEWSVAMLAYLLDDANWPDA